MLAVGSGSLFLGKNLHGKRARSERMNASRWIRRGTLLVLTVDFHLACTDMHEQSAQQEKSAIINSLTERYLEPSLKDREPIAGISLAVYYYLLGMVIEKVSGERYEYPLLPTRAELSTGCPGL
ncbi:MAG TPA: hypothetical protein VFO10_26635 [Oligoflexus sp.]|uniref:hypothetical protein n=1 Tax=Oligoflexus sp. TaxID=1971216 RepID=UPI002D80B901|nr:hypothetical protein [Oligoflexus sp.]HET9240870.1 hypothetical protein [Oligoflexus sp.]